MRRRAVSLVERLIELGDEAAMLRAEVASLRRGSEATGGGVEPSTATHPWPMRDERGLTKATLGYYEHRVDDAVLATAAEGSSFMRRHDLLGPNPGFAAAAQEISRRAPMLREAEEPDVSVVIPVHGQLAWTLNCLDALLAHECAATVEVIVVDDASPDATAHTLAPLVRVQRMPRNAGFIAACNAGAELARGRYVVLLNNDTRVLPGWLDALLESFTLFPRAGLVGSKLLYPDGTLQEAGAILWRDGSAWNYGRNDDPNRPQYSHARRVDYVSGASIAVPRELWRTLGGLDPFYAPAYSEDADLAMRVRAAGHEVWLQPQSRVIHYEGRTSGTDVATGVKAHQAVNMRRFYMRWRDTLASHRPNGIEPYHERERGQTRRALVIDATTPTPKQDAGSVTTTQTLTLFQALGYKAHYVPQDNFLFEPEHTDALLRLGVECAYSPYEKTLDDFLARYGGLFDVVLVYRVAVLEQSLALVRQHAPQACVLFHNMDLHYLRLERIAALSGAAADAEAAAAMRSRELELIGQVDCTITHSTHERDLLAEAAPDAPVVVWPYMTPLHGTAVGFGERRDFCFLGGYRHPPNVDAAVWLAREVMPLIRRRLPDARCLIVGANAGDDVLALAGDGVDVVGAVDDLRSVFDRVRVFACGVRVGAGVKGKVSTAMAYGLPVVSTTIGAEGMGLADGADVLIADGAEAFAAACVRAHEDASLWERLSAAGLALVAERHSLDMGRAVLAHAIEVGLCHKLDLPGMDFARPTRTVAL